MSSTRNRRSGFHVAARVHSKKKEETKTGDLSYFKDGFSWHWTDVGSPKVNEMIKILQDLKCYQDKRVKDLKARICIKCWKVIYEKGSIQHRAHLQTDELANMETANRSNFLELCMTHSKVTDDGMRVLLPKVQPEIIQTLETAQYENALLVSQILVKQNKLLGKLQANENSMHAYQQTHKTQPRTHCQRQTHTKQSCIIDEESSSSSGLSLLGKRKYWQRESIPSFTDSEMDISTKSQESNPSNEQNIEHISQDENSGQVDSLSHSSQSLSEDQVSEDQKEPQSTQNMSHSQKRTHNFKIQKLQDRNTNGQLYQRQNNLGVLKRNTCKGSFDNYKTLRVVHHQNVSEKNKIKQKRNLFSNRVNTQQTLSNQLLFRSLTNFKTETESYQKQTAQAIKEMSSKIDNLNSKLQEICGKISKLQESNESILEDQKYGQNQKLSNHFYDLVQNSISESLGNGKVEKLVKIDTPRINMKEVNNISDNMAENCGENFSYADLLEPEIKELSKETRTKEDSRPSSPPSSQSDPKKEI